VKEKIIGGIIVVVLGGTTFAVSQTDVVNNFANETGMSQQQAEEYVDKVQSDLASFDQIGTDLITDGNTITATATEMDCVNYAYEWESPSLSCFDGQAQLRTLGANETKLGECYKALDADLGAGAKAKISECITDIDAVSVSYELPIATAIMTAEELTDTRNSNAYNKSVLKSSLES